MVTEFCISIGNLPRKLIGVTNDGDFTPLSSAIQDGSSIEGSPGWLRLHFESE
ncbi:hypothetical protein RISK_005965 [Rhodopirellula islandica]|uniref:Uncharacterized protein n=1 Tax=Rhodopirellula islandica TaxID=595434 RepID=A0A0J1B5B5_RHOIS|nr:hypothetical protein RISK_005965 [Rhodopirellula islandica]